jgi:hypothetical protein
MSKTKKKKNSPKMTSEVIGTVGVETGQILIIDPSHAKNPLIYPLSVWATLKSGKDSGEIEVGEHPQAFGTAVAVGGFGGDGIYEVSVVRKDGVVVGLIIDLENGGWKNDDRTEEQWNAIQSLNQARVKEVGDHFTAHNAKPAVRCYDEHISKGEPCVCGKHEAEQHLAFTG